MSTKKLQVLDSLTIQPDWNQEDDAKSDYIKNKPLAEIAQVTVNAENIQALEEKTAQFVIENNELCMVCESESGE
jgi:hypothetical protein